ncbi:hypothetical protein [Burkholderia sp. Bp9031]|uniref:hypothetical protein n=1 Tax=Burkholderia sp. Bp9031 TaxID=2184566 RepID=UPI000F5D9269|nr:hypothetical protein [Burkholderia sp. Bp9031]
MWVDANLSTPPGLTVSCINQVTASALHCAARDCAFPRSAKKCADKSTEQFAIDCIALSMAIDIGQAE